MGNRTTNNKMGIMNKVSCRIFKKKKNIFNAVFASVVAVFMAASVANAAPSGGDVVAGDANIDANGNTTTINQNTQNAIINWNSFSIGVNEIVNFLNTGGATLNKVVGKSATEILGALNATGSVYVMNENGVMVGDSGQVTVGGTFVATTHNISNADFMNGGELNLSGNSSEAVVNLGKIQGNEVYLIGGGVVQNAGLIDAKDNVGLISADDVVLMAKDDAGIKYQVITPKTNAAKLADNVNPMAAAIKGGGKNSGASVQVVNGRVVIQSGKVTAGGNVDVIADRGETILSSGSYTSGRNVNVGGYFQGGSAVNSALPKSLQYASVNTTVQNNARVVAEDNAVLWADDTQLFGGYVKGHDVEVSGKNDLILQNGLKNIELTQKNGEAGTLLLDPSDINIVDGDGPDITNETATANTLYNQDVQDFLNNSGNLSIQTSDGVAGNGDIDVDADIAWASNSKLSMKAHRDININGKTIDASANTGTASYLAYAGRDVNVKDGSVIRSGELGSIDLNAATTNPFGSNSADGRIGNWKDGTGRINLEGDVELQARNFAFRSGKDETTGERADFGDNVTLKNHTGKFGNMQIHGFKDVDINVNGTNDDYESELSFLVNAKNINIDEDYDVTGAYLLNAAAYDDTTGDFVEYDGPAEYNSLGGFNGSGWKENSGTVNFADDTDLSLCCGVTINSGKDANGNRVDMTKDKVNFAYNRDYKVYNWFQVHGFDDFETNIQDGKLNSNTYVDIQNNNNLIDFDIEAGKDITSASFNKAGSNGDVLIVSDEDTTIAANTDINASDDVTVVVDEQSPFAPSDGKLVMDETATITSGGTTAFFTSTQDLNEISGTINGEKFSPGEEYINSSIEEWLVFYQNMNRDGKYPYKVYYKDNGNPNVGGGLDCDEESGDPACENFVELLDNRREYRVALSGEGQDVGEETLAIGSSEDIRTNEFYTALDANYVDTTLTTNERFGLLYSVPLDLVQLTLLDVAGAGIQGIAELMVSPVTSQF